VLTTTNNTGTVNITGNTAVDNGGGALIAVNGEPTLTENWTISNNTAGGNGGGLIAAGGAIVTMQGATIRDNEADGNGGGVYICLDTTLIMTNGFIRNNTAGGNGGGLFSPGNSEITIEGGIINNNEADLDGGGIYVGEDVILAITNYTQIMNNTADNGGGLFIEHDHGNIPGVTIGNHVRFTGNVARDGLLPNNQMVIDNPQIAPSTVSESWTEPDPNNLGGFRENSHVFTNYDINISETLLRRVTFAVRNGTRRVIDSWTNYSYG